MRRFYLNILSIILLLMCSCAEENREDNSITQQGTIGFWSYVGSSTRGEDRVDANFSSFCVTAYTVGSDGYLDAMYIPKDSVARTTLSSDAWYIQSGNKYYWPLTTPLSFFAFYPTSSTPFVEMADSSADPYIPSIDYTADFFADNQPDIIAACELNLTKSDAAAVSTPVNLTFSHIMTKINFSVQGANTDLTYHVTEIKVIAHHKGEFFFDMGYDDSSRMDTSIDTSTAKSTIGWWDVYEAGYETTPEVYSDVYGVIKYADGTTSSTSSADVDTREFIYFDNEDEPMSVGPDSESQENEMTLEDGNSFMMIPQTLPSNAQVSVTYYITYKTFTIAKAETKTISLDGAVWNIGNNLLYRLILPTTDLTEIVVDIDSISDWEVEETYNVYTGPVTVETLVVNGYNDEAMFNEEDAGLGVGVEVEGYGEEVTNTEEEAGVVGDVTVNEYDDDDNYDESEAGVVGDVTVEDYDEEKDNDESEAGVVGDITVNDYDDDDTYDESEAGVVGDVTVEDYDEETDNNESEAGIVGDVEVNDYDDESEYDESAAGVVGDIEVEDYDETKDNNESEAGIVGDTTVNDYDDEDEYEESAAGGVGDVEVDGYTEENDNNESEAGIVGDTTVNDYDDKDEYDETESGVVGEVDVDGYTEETDNDEEDAGIVSGTDVNDYSDSGTFDESDTGVGGVDVDGYTEEVTSSDKDDDTAASTTSDVNDYTENKNADLDDVAEEIKTTDE